MLTLSNGITFLRIGLSPFIIHYLLSSHWTIAFVLILCAGFTDFLDGYIARALKQTSLFGERFDPLADKILLVSIFFTLWIVGKIPGWLIIIITFRDVLLIMGALYVMVTRKNIPLHPLWLSKVNTTLQIVYILWMMAGLSWMGEFPFINTFMAYLIAIVTGITMIQYTYRFMNSMKRV